MEKETNRVQEGGLCVVFSVLGMLPGTEELGTFS